MAGRARHFSMGSRQRKPRIAVVYKISCTPFFRRAVAPLAFGGSTAQELPAVHIRVAGGAGELVLVRVVFYSKGARVQQMAVRARILELPLMRVCVAVLAGGRCGSKLANTGRIDLVALYAGHSLVRPLQGIGLAVPTGADEGWNKTILPMTIATGRVFFDKLSGMGVGMATPALIWLPQVAGLFGV